MTDKEIFTELGKPDLVQGRVLIYDAQFGMSVICSRAWVVGAVFCGDSALKNSGVKIFKGHTPEGIGMKSTRAELIQVYGRAHLTAKPWAVGQEQLEFKPLGLTFVLENGKVIHIEVNLRRPK